MPPFDAGPLGPASGIGGRGCPLGAGVAGTSMVSVRILMEAAGGGVRLRRRERLGFLVYWRCSGVPPCIPGL